MLISSVRSGESLPNPKHFFASVGRAQLLDC